MNTLISDSGITRIRMTADVRKVFDRASEPHWFFPEGIFVEQFDSLFNTEVTIKADTAWNFTDRELWQLKDNVRVDLADGTQINLEELFWNQSEGRFFADRDRFLEIREPNGNIARGWGFEASQDFTTRRIYRPTGEMWIVDNLPPPAYETPFEEFDEETPDNGAEEEAEEEIEEEENAEM